VEAVSEGLPASASSSSEATAASSSSVAPLLQQSSSSSSVLAPVSAAVPQASPVLGLVAHYSAQMVVADTGSLFKSKT
jgi:hypothetical protein